LDDSKRQFTDEELLPISALQHLLFCPRQCALIHIENQWAENILTAQGKTLHVKAHEGMNTTRQGVRTTRTLWLCSYRLGLIGQADIVEFENLENNKIEQNISTFKMIENARADKSIQSWRVTPIEYKRGKPKTNDCDRIQLCAQAMCLEEMLKIIIEYGYLFYGSQKRRHEVVFTNKLRTTTESACKELRKLIDSQKTPSANYETKCERCSLMSVCLPKVQNKKSAISFINRSFSIDGL